MEPPVSTAERRQQDFDKVWQHFVVNQGRPGYQNGSCALKTRDGAYCAIGLLVPEPLHRVLGTISLYRRVWNAKDQNAYTVGCYAECVDTFALRDDVDPEIPAFIREDPAFYCRMQYAHDSAASWSDADYGPQAFTHRIESELRHFAKHYGLIVPAGGVYGHQESH